MSARHWSRAICTQVDPAPVTVGPVAPVCSAPGPSAVMEAASASIAAVSTRVPRLLMRFSTEPPVYVVGGARVVGVAEDLRRRADLDDAAGLPLVDVEERAAIRDALRLLHVVRHDH